MMVIPRGRQLYPHLQEQLSTQKCTEMISVFFGNGKLIYSLNGRIVCSFSTVFTLFDTCMNDYVCVFGA